MKHGFIKAATAVPVLNVGDPKFNAESIISTIGQIKEEVELMLFPELCITASSCADLFSSPLLTEECKKALTHIAEKTRGKETIIVVGTPIMHKSAIFNCAAVIHKGEIMCLVPQRAQSSKWFTSSSYLNEGETTIIADKRVPFLKSGIIETQSFTFGIEIGEDAETPIAPGAELAIAGAQIILNPTARAEEAGTHLRIKERVRQQSRRYKCIYMQANSGWGESTSSGVHSGYCAIAECGNIIAESERFLTSSHTTAIEADVEKVTNRRIGDPNFSKRSIVDKLYIPATGNCLKTFERRFNPTPFIPQKHESSTRYEEIFTIQATALARRMAHTCSKSAVIGISGGLDSTLALLVTAKAFDILGKPHSDITAVTMPGFGTTDRTYNNALSLMNKLKVTIREISIKEACIQHFKDIGHDADNHDTTYENSQARERTQILMDIANKQNGLVIGTGDMSELALGWATYNGDHMSMYGVNASVPKTLIQHIVRWVAENCDDTETSATLIDILDTPISPELTPADNNGNIKQKTEDLVGPYELHDFFLYHFLRNRFSPEKISFMAKNAFEGIHNSETIDKWLNTFVRRFFTQQFKRSCMPDSPKTGSCNFSREDGWNMPADCSSRLWSEQDRK